MVKVRVRVWVRVRVRVRIGSDRVLWMCVQL